MLFVEGAIHFFTFFTQVVGNGLKPHVEPLRNARVLSQYAHGSDKTPGSKGRPTAGLCDHLPGYMTHTQSEWMWMYLCEMHADWDSRMLREVYAKPHGNTGPGRGLRHHARRAGWHARRPEDSLNAVPRPKRWNATRVSWLDLAAEPSNTAPKTMLDQRPLDVIKINLRRAQGSLDKEYNLAMAATAKAQKRAETPADPHDTEQHGGRETVNQSTAPTADNGQTATRPGDGHEGDTGGVTPNNAQAMASAGQPPTVPASDSPQDVKAEIPLPSLPCGQAQDSPDSASSASLDTQQPLVDSGTQANTPLAVKTETPPDTPPPAHTPRVIGTGTAVCLEQVHHASQCDNAVCPVHVSSTPLSSSLAASEQQQGAGCTAAQNTVVAPDTPDPPHTPMDSDSSLPSIKPVKIRKRPRRCRDSPVTTHINKQLVRNKRQLSPDGDQLTVDNDNNGTTKRYKDGLPDSCTNSSDDGYYDLDSPETGRVTVSPRLLRSREVLEHGQATSSPALTSLRDLVRNQIWHLTPDKAKKPAACQTINPGSGSKRKVKDTVNLAPNPVKIAKRLKALPDEDFNQITLHTGDLKGLGSNPAEIIRPRKIIRKLAGRHVYLSPTESKGQGAVALSPKEFATMIHTYGQVGIDKSPPREVHITTPRAGPHPHGRSRWSMRYMTPLTPRPPWPHPTSLEIMNPTPPPRETPPRKPQWPQVQLHLTGSWTSPPQGNPQEPGLRTPTSETAVTRLRSCRPGKWKPGSRPAPKRSQNPPTAPRRPGPKHQTT